MYKMRKIVIILFCIPFFATSQQIINDSIDLNGTYRHFITYIPAVYNQSTPTPLVFNFHGKTGTSFSTMYHADFRDIADTANFIIVHPQGLLDSTGVTHWNYGQSNIDDIGFINELYTHLVNNLYNIDIDKVYTCGMSNGGAMSYYLACSNMSNKIAAIASVTGAMTSYQHLSCNPAHPTPVIEIHGTDDLTIPFNVILPGIEYWRNYNNCNLVADTTVIPDLILGDWSTVEHIVYNNGNNGVTTELFKIIGGGHTWPGSNFPNSNGITNYDINASEEIWKFFSRYDINGLINSPNNITESEKENKKVLKIINLLGQEVNDKHNQPIFYIYDDKTVNKKIIIE